VVRRDAVINRTEDLMSKSAKKRSHQPAQTGAAAAKPSPLAIPDPPSPEERRAGLEAIPRHCDAAITRGGNNCSDDESHGLAATFGARLPCWRSASGDDRTLTCPAICCFAFWRIGSKPTI